jgi:tetratricopeptide (TPR) repeat protein
MADRAQEIEEATRLARRAVVLGRDDAYALCMAGFTLAYVARDFDGGAAAIDRALTLNPNWATGWTLSGWTRVWRGEPETAIEHLANAIRLSPLDPLLFAMQSALAFAHFLVGRYDEATGWAKKALLENPKYLATLRITAASHALAGRLEEARQAMTRLRELDPALRVSTLKDHISFRRSDDLLRYADGLRKAGLPE